MRQGEAAVEVAALPAVEDVVMYQVNPRVFAPEKSFKAVMLNSSIAASFVFICSVDIISVRAI